MRLFIKQHANTVLLIIIFLFVIIESGVHYYHDQVNRLFAQQSEQSIRHFSDITEQQFTQINSNIHVGRQEWNHLLDQMKGEFNRRFDLLHQRAEAMQALIVSLQEMHANTEGQDLPFSIQSLDIWNGQPYVHIISKTEERQEHDLARFETFRGWKLMEIDLHHSSVIFENHDHQIQKVKVHLHLSEQAEE